MKNILASVIFCFLAVNLNLHAEYSKEELQRYLQDQIYNCSDQLDDLSFDLSSGHAGYIFGQKTAYMDILKKIKD